MTNPFRALIAFFALAALAAPAAAQNVDISFTPNVVRAITTNYTGNTNLGVVEIGSAVVSGAAISITNTPGTVGTTLAVAVSSPAVDQGPAGQNWVLSTSTSPGVDSFALFAVFQSTKPANGQYADALHRVPEDTSPTQAQCANDFPNASPTERFRGGQSGVRVAPGGGTVNLWLNLYPPTRSSNLKAKQIIVTVTTGGCD